LIFYEIFFFTLTLFSFNIIYAQAWQTVGSHGLGNVADIIEYNGNIYIVGDIDEIGGVVMNHVAMWDGSSWTSLGSGLGEYGSCMGVYSNELYVGGYFQTAGGISANKIAKWNGSTWSNVSTGLDMMLAPHDMETIENILYIGGSPDLACNTPKVNMVSWNGTSIETVSSGELELISTSIVNGTVYSLSEYQGELYVAGYFDFVEGISCEGLLRWDGVNWAVLPSGHPTNFNLEVEFIAGKLTVADNSSGVSQWDGTSWVDYIAGWSGNGSTYAMIEYNSTPVIGGAYNNVPYSLNSLGNWNPVGVMPGSIMINKMEIIENELYAVGRHYVDVNGNVEQRALVMKWVGGPLSVDQKLSTKFVISPNPSSGIFTLEQPLAQSGKLTVYNLFGHIIFEKKIESTTTTFDLSRYNAGVYIVNISHDMETYTKRIIVH
jgi:hypothetical protein